MNHTATYSPEDNKLRLYPAHRLDREDYDKLRAAGFRWAPKQGLFVCPRWTPTAEDVLLEFVDEIGDEDYSPEERAADRAERFAGYRDKRRAEAHGHADTFQAGPAAFGHQSQARAERQAARHDRHRTRSLSQWSKAEYWQERTKAVIAHALHRSSASVRRGRLLTLESEQRKHLASIKKAQTQYNAWARIATMEGADELLPLNEDGYAIPDQMNEAQRLAYTLANTYSYVHLYHPTSEEANEEARQLWKHGFSAYDFLTKTDFIGKPFERLTPKQFAELFLEKVLDPSTPGTNSARWTAHYELRIAYEKAMLEAEGGLAGEVEIEPGGFFGRYQVQSVNRSPVTGRVVSVKVYAPKKWYRGEGEAPMTLQSVNIERLGADAYRAPTDEEREAFKRATAERKAKEKASKPKSPSLINPTDEDAERLQAILNERAKAKHDAQPGAKYMKDFEPTRVLRITQAQYSANSKGTYSKFETRTVHNAGGIIARRSSNMWSSAGSEYDKALGAAACKIRIRSAGGWDTPPHIVVITDKPQKSLPLDWQAIESGAPAKPQEQPAEAESVETVAEETANV